VRQHRDFVAAGFHRARATFTGADRLGGVLQTAKATSLGRKIRARRSTCRPPAIRRRTMPKHRSRLRTAAQSGGASLGTPTIPNVASLTVTGPNTKPPPGGPPGPAARSGRPPRPRPNRSPRPPRPSPGRSGPPPPPAATPRARRTTVESVPGAAAPIPLATRAIRARRRRSAAVQLKIEPAEAARTNCGGGRSAADRRFDCRG
jgi:hypothetical protein